MARLTVDELRQALVGIDPNTEVVVASPPFGAPTVEGVALVGARVELDVPDAAHECEGSCW
ncbi:MAG: hypothetical protein FWF90_11495 [Promicromonosporaceae bacterium]|nr:hypothetical protein [Promicromonosporaceae bacterium]